MPGINELPVIKEIFLPGKQALGACGDRIFNNEEIDQVMQNTKKTQSCQPDLEGSDFKINQKGCFLVVGMVLEKLLFWDPIKLVQESIIPMIDWTKKLYQKVRPGRNNTRTSRSAPSKWCNKVKQARGLKA